MSDITRLREAIIARILQGDGRASRALRRAAFDNDGLPAPLKGLIEEIARRAYTVTDDDIAAVRAAGFSEDQIFELVICAAMGAANRQYHTALAALDAAVRRE